MLRSVTAKKIDWFVKDLDEGTRAVAAALTSTDLGYRDLRSILSAVNSALTEVGEVYNALKSQAGNVRGLVAASQSSTFDDALGKVVTIATRLDLLRSVIADELGVPEAEVPGMEGDVEQAPISGGEIADELNGGEIPTAIPSPVDSNQPVVEASEDEEDFDGDDDDEDDDDEDGEGYGDDEDADEDEDEDVNFHDDEDDEDEAPREATSRRRFVQAKKQQKANVRNSITARRSNASAGSALPKRLFDFIGR